MTTPEPTLHLYSDYAWLWPLWGDADGEYAEWCDLVQRLMQTHARRELHTLLNLGCGGGKNVANLKHHYAVTGVDISSAMLDLARQLNPECTFVQADMRTCQLAQHFDAVLIDDAITYMTSRADLTRVFATAYAHLAPGGVMVVTPDYLVETFQQNETRVSHASATHKPAHLDVVFVEMENGKWKMENETMMLMSMQSNAPWSRHIRFHVLYTHQNLIRVYPKSVLGVLRRDGRIGGQCTRSQHTPKAPLERRFPRRHKHIMLSPF